MEIVGDEAKIHKKSTDESPFRYTRQEAGNRAYSQYNVAINNCDSLVRWCRAG